MKIANKWWALSMMLACTSSLADGTPGTGDGGGGNEIELDFAASGQALIEILKDREAEFPELKPADFEATVAKAKIQASAEPLYDALGVPKTALNYPSTQTIRVHIASWKDILQEHKTKLSLSFHEYLGLAGVRDSRYEISARLFKLDPEMLAYGRLGKLRAARYRPITPIREGDIETCRYYIDPLPGQLQLVLSSYTYCRSVPGEPSSPIFITVGRSIRIQCTSIHAQNCTSEHWYPPGGGDPVSMRAWVTDTGRVAVAGKGTNLGSSMVYLTAD